MGVILAISAAFALGTGDFFGGVAAQRAPVWTVVLWSNLAGAVVAVAGAIVLADGTSSTDLAWGAAAGLCGGVATVCLYRGLAIGAMSVVAPLSAAVGAALPVVAGLLTDGWPPAVVTLGLVVGLLAAPLVSASTTPATSARWSLVLAVAAGLGLGGFLVLLSQTEGTHSFWPLVAARAASIPLMAFMAQRRGAGLLLAAGARRPALLAGGLDMASNALFVMAAWQSDLATVGLLTSLYPVSTVLLAHLALGERVRPVQRVGMMLALTSVVLVALN
jgi:uncharacterized membrane protein